MAPKLLPASHHLHQQQQFGARSVERVLEEAISSGELLRAGRKLKDFPKVLPVSGSLEDTVFAGKVH